MDSQKNTEGLLPLSSLKQHLFYKRFTTPENEAVLHHPNLNLTFFFFFFFCEFKVQCLKKSSTFQQRTKQLQRETGGVSSSHLYKHNKNMYEQ